MGTFETGSPILLFMGSGVRAMFELVIMHIGVMRSCLSLLGRINHASLMSHGPVSELGGHLQCFSGIPILSL